LVIDWQHIDKFQYLQAMERSPINDLECMSLLKANLSADVSKRDMIFKELNNPSTTKDTRNQTKNNLALFRIHPILFHFRYQGIDCPANRDCGLTLVSLEVF
jgi:hypothetical protein